jgi:cathepsin L
MIYQTLLLAAATATATASSLDLNRATFESFIKTHIGKHKWNEEEYATRKGMFQAELARVIAHNDGSKSWKEGLNKFSIMTASEKSFYHGHSKRAAADHKPTNQKPFDMTLKAVSDLPESVDWRDHKPNVVTSVKDQGHCGSCWAFAAAAVLESQVALSTGLLFDFSPQQIAMCSPNPNHCGGAGGCDGATAEIAFDYLVNGKDARIIKL